MSVEQYIHSAAELRALADLVDAMNNFEAALNNYTVSVQCGPEIWWADSLMGHIVRQDEYENEGKWCYRPARGEDGPIPVDECKKTTEHGQGTE